MKRTPNNKMQRHNTDEQRLLTENEIAPDSFSSYTKNKTHNFNKRTVSHTKSTKKRRKRKTVDYESAFSKDMILTRNLTRNPTSQSDNDALNPSKLGIGDLELDLGLNQKKTIKVKGTHNLIGQTSDHSINTPSGSKIESESFTTKKTTSIQKSVKFRRNMPKKNKFLIYPDDYSNQIWFWINFTAILYSCIIAPFNLAFPPSNETIWFILDKVTDSIFILDTLLNFFKAYHDCDQILIDKRKKIVINYLTGWFLFDFMSSFPFDWIIGNNINDLFRLSKIPKLIKAFRIMKFLKFLRISNQSPIAGSKLSFLIKNTAIKRLIGSLFACFIAFHVIACLFIYIAAANMENDTNWILRLGFIDSSYVENYITSWYWTLQTVFTVGYGDFPLAQGPAVEKSFACLWMISGAIVYSFLIGSFTQIFSKINESKQKIKFKLKMLNNFSSRYKIPRNMYFRARRAIIEGNENQTFNHYEFLDDLPIELKSEVGYYVYKELVENIEFFRDKPHSFITEIGPYLKKVKLQKDQWVFCKDDRAEEIFFITDGSVTVMHPEYDEFPIIKVNKGYYFGEADILRNIEVRRASIKTNEDCELLVVHKKAFKYLFIKDDYKEFGEEVLQTALMREAKFKQLLKDANALIDKHLKDPNHKTKNSKKKTKLITNTLAQNIQIPYLSETLLANEEENLFSKEMQALTKDSRRNSESSDIPMGGSMTPKRLSLIDTFIPTSEIDVDESGAINYNGKNIMKKYVENILNYQLKEQQINRLDQITGQLENLQLYLNTLIESFQKKLANKQDVACQTESFLENDDKLNNTFSATDYNSKKNIEAC